MAEENIKNKVLTGLFWKIMENGGVQGVQFVVSIVLARILTPDEYGTISLITIFITIANVFIQSGFNTALIQKREADELDFSSVFYLSLGIAGVIYLILKLMYWDRFSAGVAPLMIGVFFLGALQLFFIGFLGEYVLSINTRVLDRPLVVEEERLNFEEEDEDAHETEK